MVNVYSFVDEGDAGDTIQRLEDVVIRLALQTIECGIFILHYTSNVGVCCILSYTFDGLMMFLGLLLTINQPRKQSRTRRT